MDIVKEIGKKGFDASKIANFYLLIEFSCIF